MRTPFYCANVNHAARRNRPGWTDDALGYVEGGNPQASSIGYICEACAAAWHAALDTFGLAVAAQRAAEQAHLPNPPDPGPPPHPLAV